MRIRFGYVAMAIDLHNCSPSKTINFSQFNKIQDDDVKLYKLKKITEQNLINTKRILLYNVAHNIKVYRITSKLVPLVTHPEVIHWDYINEFNGLYEEIKNIIINNNLRISAHPDHFTILASPNPEVVESSINDLVYHNKILSSFGLNSKYGKLVLHIGGKYNSKGKTIERFKSNFIKIDDSIRKRIILENDDKIYDMIDVLEICEELNIPMVLDIHHQRCNNRGEKIEDYIERIFNTWNSQEMPPKIHLSSPKSEKDFRAHADNIDFDFFNQFIKMVISFDRDFDIMIEAKNKNLALFQLMKEIKQKTKFKIINEAEIEI